jgi:hypothetical protein
MRYRHPALLLQTPASGFAIYFATTVPAQHVQQITLALASWVLGLQPQTSVQCAFNYAVLVYSHCVKICSTDRGVGVKYNNNINTASSTVDRPA